MDRASNGPHPGPRTGNFTVEDQRSSGRQRNFEAENAQKTCENRPKKCFTQENSRQMSREFSRLLYWRTKSRHRPPPGTSPVNPSAEENLGSYVEGIIAGLSQQDKTSDISFLAPVPATAEANQQEKTTTKESKNPTSSEILEGQVFRRFH